MDPDFAHVSIRDNVKAMHIRYIYVFMVILYFFSHFYVILIGSPARNVATRQNRISGLYYTYITQHWASLNSETYALLSIVP